MCAYKGRIAVEDANGVHLDLHEFSCRRFLRRISRFELDTGELVERIDRDHYVIASTGETLVRKDA